MSLLILSRKLQDSCFEVPYSLGVKGAYKVQVCRNGHVIREPFGPKFIPNLITDTGLDFLMTTLNVNLWARSIQYCRVGTGTTTPAASDTDLGTNVKQTSTLTGSGSSYSNDLIGGAVTFNISYEFSAESTSISYTEIGLAYTGTGTSPGIFTHALFPTGVTLNSGDNLRLVYSFTWSVPATVTPITVSLAPVNGFNISGSMKVVGTFANIFGTLLAGDTYIDAHGPGSYLQSYLSGVLGSAPYLMSAPTSFPAVNTALTETLITGANGSYVNGSYTNGSFSRSSTLTWTPSQPSTTVTNVNMIKLEAQTNGNGLYLLLSTAQTKANTNTLVITLQTTLSRI